MSLRDRIAAGLKDATRARDRVALSTLRLINAAVKDREIAARGSDGAASVLPDSEILAILSKMVRQRQESARTYEEAGRLELAEKERAEIAVIEGFMPRPMTDAEIGRAVQAAITELGAESIRDMGKVMAALKARHSGQMDFGQAG
ncbi:MAG: GatB/YqeY domain-containing protein [Rhodobacteraceae bacterium]|nr:GatB/YqeY domain-containing protein [Paracoccaceae bacterium]